MSIKQGQMWCWYFLKIGHIWGLFLGILEPRAEVRNERSTTHLNHFLHRYFKVGLVHTSQIHLTHQPFPVMCVPYSPTTVPCDYVRPHKVTINLMPLPDRQGSRGRGRVGAHRGNNPLDGGGWQLLALGLLHQCDAQVLQLEHHPLQQGLPRVRPVLRQLWAHRERDTHTEEINMSRQTETHTEEIDTRWAC